MTYKYRLFPTSAQRTSLEKVLELCRGVDNDTLAIRKETYEQTGKSISLYDTHKRLTEWKAAKPGLSQVHAQVLQNGQERVDWAYQAFLRRVKAGEDEAGFPRFRGKGGYERFTFKQSGFKLDGDRLFLAKIGHVYLEMHRPLCAPVKTLTIQRDTVGNWYACFSCAPSGYPEPSPLEPSHKVVGVDRGLTPFASLSEGEKIERQRWMKVDAADIARLQRKKEKLAKGSPERRQVIHALGHAYERAANRRRNFAHPESRQLVNAYQFIAFEKLAIQERQARPMGTRLWAGNQTVSRGIADVAWGQFVQFTAYQAANAGRTVTLVNPRGTTHACAAPRGHPGSLVPKDLSVRIHACPNCGLVLDRDHNAALNILARGLSCLSAGSPVVAVEAHD